MSSTGNGVSAADDPAAGAGSGRGRPAWFEAALADAADPGSVEVDGATIHYLAWGPVGAPGLVLVHGGAAHAHWWSAVAPLISAGVRRVVALDLSGNGDSGWRERYTLGVWASEVLAVADHAGVGGKPILVGHSLGGVVAVAATARDPSAVAATVVVDSGIRRPDPNEDENQRRSPRPRRSYPDLASGVARFRLIPDQPLPPVWMTEHVARHSLREEADGWTWKADPALSHRTSRRRRSDIASMLDRMTGPVAVLYGERSAIVGRDVLDFVAERLPRPVPIVGIPAAHHHVQLDQPLAVVAALGAVLAMWEANGDAAGC